MSKPTSAAVFGSLLALTVIGQPVPVDAQPGGAARTLASEQATRQITQSITRRTTQAVLSAAERKKPEELADAWVSSSYTNITFSSRDTEFYQVVGGADKRLGSFYAGASVGYTNEDSSAHITSFSPYAAYLINDHVFLTGTAGYARLEDDSDLSTDANALFTDLSVTALLPLNEWIVVGQFGHRISYSVREPERSLCDIEIPPAEGALLRLPDCDDDFFVNPDVDNDSFVNTLYLTGEVGYRIDRWLPYFHASYERLIFEEGVGGENVFVGLGATYDFSDVFSAGLAYNTELTLQDATYHQAVLDIRFRF